MKTIELIRKYENAQKQFEDSLSAASSASVQRAKQAFDAAYDATKFSLVGVSKYKQSLESLLKSYTQKASKGELSPAERGELKAVLEPKIYDFYDKAYTKLSSKLYNGVNADEKAVFSQTKMLNDMGVLDHGGRCLPLAKMYLVAVANDKLPQLFSNLEFESQRHPAELAHTLHELHAKTPHATTLSGSYGFEEIAQLLASGDDAGYLLNTPTHSMAVAKKGGEYYFLIQIQYRLNFQAWIS